ncbi:hypothetical protein CAPTEDRAFT_206689 [Capitella teleta]|uniref:N-acetyltransferase domain-containing protein n=1 Tax=Capitella teleta TaxID=283909 RepID=R7VD87_CAPTE|nr:hypothetical protein CAPTEDRAFT_206689 [Capitella teleta]|eukprot:ELU14256.1 hypothetical protein CAPTEDRAFT_206689 [Capitella teleta]
MASELSRRREPMIETIELAGRIITLREASIEDAERILQMSREVCGPWDYLPSALFPLFNHPRARIYVAEHEQQIVALQFVLVDSSAASAFAAGSRTLKSYQKHRIMTAMGQYAQRALRTEFPRHAELVGTSKTPHLMQTQVDRGECQLRFRWKMTEFELNGKKGERISGICLSKERAVSILLENSSSLFADVFLYSHLWIPCEPSRLSLADAYSSTNTLFYFSGPDRLSGVAFFDAVSAEAGTLATVFCYTSRDSHSQLVFEMLQSVVSHLQTTAQRGKPIRLGIHFPLSCDGDEFMNRLTASAIVQPSCSLRVTECALAAYPAKPKHKL